MSQEMFEQDAQYLWADMLDEARSKGQDDLIAWLERARPVSFDGTVMRLVTKQKWAARNLTGRYREAVEALMAEITMEPVTLEVEVEGGSEVPVTTSATATSPGFPPTPSPAETVGASTCAPTPASMSPMPTAPAAQRNATDTAANIDTEGCTSGIMPGTNSPASQTNMQAGMQAQPQPATQVAPQNGAEPPAIAAPAQAAAFIEPTPSSSQAHEGTPYIQAQGAPATCAPLSAAALAGRAATTGRPRIHSRILSGEVPMPNPTVQPGSATAKSTGAHHFPSPVSTPVENSAAHSPRGAGTSQPIPVLEEGTEQKYEVKAQSSTDFTFDTYVVGDSNIMAYRVARSVAEQPDGSLFNPVFIWGPSGNGKTHLLLAIQSYINANQPRTRVEYISADMFLTRYIDEVHNQKLRGRAVLKDMDDIDVLLVDDVQEFHTQQVETVGALFNIFNNFMLAGNKQIVLAADRAPDYLDLDPRLKSRFAQGMVQDIKAPTWEMKLSILKSFYERYRARNGMTSVRIDDEGFKVMADYGPDSPRNMTGFINSIMFNAEHDPSLLTPDGIRTFIETQYNVAKAISLDKIIDAVTKEYGVTYEQITSRSRTKDIKEARQVYMWLANQLTDETYQSIGDVVGLNHATITHGIKVINEKRNADHGYARQLEDFKNRLCNESK